MNMRLSVGRLLATATVVLGTTFGAWAADKLDEVKSRGKLLVGVQTTYPQWGYLNPQTGQIEGFEVELAALVAKELIGPDAGIEVVGVNAQTRVQSLNTDRVDMLSALVTITPERMDQVSFSDVYYLSGQALVVLEGSPITSFQDLAGKSVCANLGSSEEKGIRLIVPGVEVLTYSGAPEALLALRAGRCDAYTSGRSILAIAVMTDPTLKMVGGVATFSPIGLAFKKGDDSFREAVNGILAAIGSDGRYETLYKKWFGGELPDDFKQWYGMKPEEAVARYEASIPRPK